MTTIGTHMIIIQPGPNRADCVVDAAW
jgi:hypothetical protein